MRIKNHKKTILSVLLTLVLVAGLFGGVNFTPAGPDVAKADGKDSPYLAQDEDGDYYDTRAKCEWFISTEGNVSYEEAKAGKVSVIKGPGTYYFHMYSTPQDGDEFQDKCKMFTAKEETDPDNNIIYCGADSNGKVEFGREHKAAPDDGMTGSRYRYVEKDNGKWVVDFDENGNTIEEEGTGHHVYEEVTVLDGFEDGLLIMTNYLSVVPSVGERADEDCGVVIKLKTRDPLWLPEDGDVNSLSDLVGIELYKNPGNADQEGFAYLGKAYYYSSGVMYPNVDYDTVCDQNNGDFSTTQVDDNWTVRGVYDNNGNPLGSHIFYQYYLIDKNGDMRTDDDRVYSHPISYLVYDEFPEDKSVGDTVAPEFKTIQIEDMVGIGEGFVNSCEWTDMKGDGTEVLCPIERYKNVHRTFGTPESPMDFYNIWGVYSSITVNGNVTSCVALDREKYSKMYYNKEDAEDEKAYGNKAGSTRWYVDKYSKSLLRGKYKDLFEKMYAGYKSEYGDDEKPMMDVLSDEEKQKIYNDQLFTDELDDEDDWMLNFNPSSVTDSTVIINGDVGFIDLHDTWEGTFILGNGCSFGGLGRYESSKQLFKFDAMNVVEQYSTVIGDGTPIIQNGKIVKAGIEPLKDDENLDNEVYGIDLENPDPENFNPYIILYGRKQSGKDAASTTGGVQTFGGGDSDWTAIKIDITGLDNDNIHPMLRKLNGKGTWKKGGNWWEVIRDYIGVDKATILDLALVQDNDHLVEPQKQVGLYIEGVDDSAFGGASALYHITDDGKIEKVSSNGKNGKISGETGRFSTYFIAPNVDKLPTKASPELAALVKAQREADPPVEPTAGKKANPMKVSVKTVKTTVAKVKKKKITKKAITVKKAKGKVTYKKKSGSKLLTVNKKNGKITLKKGAKKGTYKIKVIIKAAGNSNYKSKKVTKTIKFKVTKK